MHDNKPKTYRVAVISMLSALSTVLFFISGVPIFISFPYLKIDLSDIPALIGSIIFSPSAGVMIQLIKNIIHLLNTHTFGVGEGMSFIIGSLLVVSFSVSLQFFKRKYNIKINLIISFIICLCFTTLISLIFNSIIYHLLLPTISSQTMTNLTITSYLLAVSVVNLIKVSITVILSILLTKFLNIHID